MSSGRLKMPVLLRGCIGIGHSAATHHSGNYYAMFAQFPGLRVVVPSTPCDAKGLLKHALRCNDPVLFLEHREMLAIKGPVPDGDYEIEFGKAAVVREGTDVTVVALALMVQHTLKACAELASEGISVELIDPRTVAPLDIETIAGSVAKTGRLLIVDEAFAPCGIGAEIAAQLAGRGFDDLDAPIRRLNGACTPTPYSPPLEAAVVPIARSDRPGDPRPGSRVTPFSSERPDHGDRDHHSPAGLDHGPGRVRRLAQERGRCRPGRRAALQSGNRQGRAGRREPRYRPAPDRARLSQARRDRRGRDRDRLIFIHREGCAPAPASSAVPRPQLRAALPAPGAGPGSWESTGPAVAGTGRGGRVRERDVVAAAAGRPGPIDGCYRFSFGERIPGCSHRRHSPDDRRAGHARARMRPHP